MLTVNMKVVMKMPTSKLIDYFPTLLTQPQGGLFYIMTWAPWWTSADDAASLDVDYFYNHSGRKIPSQLVRTLAEQNNPPGLSSTDRANIVRVLRVKYSDQWTTLWNKYHNMSLTTGGYTYDEKETETGRDETKTTYGRTRTTSETSLLQKEGTETKLTTGEMTETDSFPQQRTTSVVTSGQYTDTDSRSTSKTGVESVTDTGSTQSSVYGFNSATAVPANVNGPLTEAGVVSTTRYGTGQPNDTGILTSQTGGVTRSYGADVDGQHIPFKTETTESGEEAHTTKYGNGADVDGISEETSFDGRKDRNQVNGTDSLSGTDTVLRLPGLTKTKSGRNEALSEMAVKDLDLFDRTAFFEKVYNDMDQVLTLGVWGC